MNNEKERNEKEDKEQKGKEKRLLVLLLLLLLITVIAVAISIWAIWFRDRGPVLGPDYAPKEIERNAEPIGDENDDKLVQPEGGGAVSLTYAKQVTISLSQKTASLLFANPTKSNQDMVICLVIDDVVILQSGRLTPGNQVTVLNLASGAEKRLAEGGYDGKFVIFYYDGTSGEKAMINTEIPVEVTVVK